MSTFEKFLNEVVAPMFPGLSVSQTDYEPVRINKAVVSEIPGATKLRIRKTSSETQFYELTRKQPFDSAEKKLIELLINNYSEVEREAPNYLTQLEDLIVRQAIAQSVSDNNEQSQIVTSILDRFSNWATETYEGERVSAGVVVTTGANDESSSIHFDDILQEDFAKALSDGVDSWWVVNAEGFVEKFQTSEDLESVSASKGFFPARYQAMALQSSNGYVGITLNRNGEVLVFANKQLKFARRRGTWVHFAHESVIRQMSAGKGAGAIELRTAIYHSCLDTSFARSGACIGLLRHGNMVEFEEAGIVSGDDLIDSGEKLKSATSAVMIGKKTFTELPRSIRKELLALDGAMVLSPNGRIIAAGAILHLEDVGLGNQGGRSAAAKTLSHYGLGIKVSEDGLISGYKKETDDQEAAFKVG